MVDARTKREVTKEWHDHFPAFDIWKPLVLLRRVGPVLQGITLDIASRQGDQYYPTAHIHVLTSAFPVISLELRCVPGHTDQGRSLYFEREHRVAANASELREKCPLPLDAVPRLDQVVAGLRQYVESFGRTDQPAPQMVDMVLVAAFDRDPSTLPQALVFVEASANTWRTPPEGFESPAAWMADLRRQAADVDRLSADVERNVLALKVDKVRSDPW